VYNEYWVESLEIAMGLKRSWSVSQFVVFFFLFEVLVIQFFRGQKKLSAEETEIVENLVDIVCSSLLIAENKVVFSECDGVDLILLLLKYL
jgi:hypothetical protein